MKQFAGSHFDNLRIKKPDEFDMDIVIGLPLNFQFDKFDQSDSDILLEHKSPGFVQLKMGKQFGKLPMRDGDEWQINKTAYLWKDERNYLLRSKFTDWFKSVIFKALNTFELGYNNRRIVYVNGVRYNIKTSQSGPALTFYIENYERNFRLDVDFVPALKFPENRWPICSGYKSMPFLITSEDFMVVPKPNKSADNNYDESRGWRLALHDQEKKLMHDLHNLKPTLRLMKKLRDSLGMTKIASYYIKTLFFWEIVRVNDREYWRQSRSQLFNIMTKKLHDALVLGQINYFWHSQNNLIGQVPRSELNNYLAQLQKLMKILDDPGRYKEVANFLLSNEEFQEYYTKFLHI